MSKSIQKLVVIIFIFSLTSCGTSEYQRTDTWVKTDDFNFVVIDKNVGVVGNLDAKVMDDCIYILVKAGQKLEEL